MVNNEVSQFIITCAHFQLVNSQSHKAQQLIQTIESDNPFHVLFIDFWELGEIQYRDGYYKIITCMDCMTGFGLVSSTGLKEIKSYQAARWHFGNFFVPFGIPKMIVVDADVRFSGTSKKTFQYILLIPVYAVARGNHKKIINEGLNRYLNKVQKINLEEKASLNQWLKGVLFALYAWNAGPVDGTDIDLSVAAIGREFPFKIDPSPARLREVN